MAALAGVQRGTQQQLAHAQHAGHRGADLVRQGRQEAALGQRSLLGQFALVHVQLPLVAAAQAAAIEPAQPQQGQRAQQGQQRQSPATAPPWRPHFEGDLLHRRPRLVRPGGGLHLQAIVARRQLREHPVAALLQLEPLVLQASHAEAVTVGARIVEGQQARAHLQVVVARLQLEAAGNGQVDHAVLALHAHRVHHQRRRRPFRIGHPGVQQQQRSIAGPGHQHAIGIQGQAVVDELLAGQAFAHAEPAHPRGLPGAAGLDPEQAAPGRQPGAMMTVHQQAGGLGGRDAAGRPHLQAAPPRPARVQVPGLQTGQAMQPDPLAAVEGEGLHRRGVHPVRGEEAPLSRIPALQARLGRDPGLAIGPDREHAQAGSVQFQEVQHPPAVGIAALQAGAGRTQPQAAVGGLRDPADRRLRGGVDLRIRFPVQGLAAGRVEPDQAGTAIDPDPAIAVLQHRQGPTRDCIGQRPGHLAGRRVQPFHQAGITHQPDPAARGPRHPAVDAAGQPMALVQHRGAAPVRTQVGQPAARYADPEPAIVLAQQRLD